MKRVVTVVTVAVVLLGVFAGCTPKQESSASGDWAWRRKVTFISPWGPGGGSGPTIRNIAPEVERVIGNPVEVVHQEGAGGLNGIVAANRQPPDGYTWVLATQTQVMLELQRRIPFSFREQFIPVARLVHSTNGLVVAAKTAVGRYSNFQEFLDDIRANPRSVTIGILSLTDNASIVQALGLGLGVSYGEIANLVRVVPYSSGSEMDAAMVGGHLDAAVGSPGDYEGLIQSGHVIPLIVMAERRLPSYPDVPATVPDFNIDATIGTWRGIFVRKGTPQAAIDAMEAALRQAWGSQAYQTFMEAEGFLERDSNFMGQEGFRNLVEEEFEELEELLKGLGEI